MVLTYEYRLLPSKRQHAALESLLESQRLLYNAALEERIGAYRRGISLSYFDQTRGLTQWRASDPDAAALPLAIQRATVKRLDEAYKGFLGRIAKGNPRAGFPRFRGKGWWDSFAFREFEGISFRGACLFFRTMPGKLRVHVHRPIPGGARIRSCCFRRDAKGWKVGFAIHIEAANLGPESRRVGVDLGINVFATLSDGRTIPSLRAARRAQRRLRLAQRTLARKKPRSLARKNARRRLAQCRRQVACARKNHLHQAAAFLVRNYDLIVVERLNLKALTRGMLARDVHDAGWGKFLTFLHYKAERAGVRVVEVDPRNTSQICSGCGQMVLKKLGERWHECPQCGLSEDRDVNAARNVLARAGVGPVLLNVAGTASVQERISDHFSEALPS